MTRDLTKDYEPAQAAKTFDHTVGDQVCRWPGAIRFVGVVVAAYRDRKGRPSYVVSNKYGVERICKQDEVTRA